MTEHDEKLAMGGEREKREIYHAREKGIRVYPRMSGPEDTWAIPLHSRGRRAREASHGEGGLQAAGKVTRLAESGLRITAGLQCSVARDR